MTIPIGSPGQPRDLAAAVFVALADEFFTDDSAALSFSLRPKLSTQDDPFDEYVRSILERRLPSELRVLASNKPLVSPDLVVARPEEKPILLGGGSRYDPRRLLAIEVKKLNANESGRVGRASGLDYNTTPPCSTVTLESHDGSTITAPAFYLFAVLRHTEGSARVETLALVSGAVLNQDVALYDAATGVRTKSIDIGSFGDGIDRQRPMFVFANPLGWPWLEGTATLLHSRSDLEDEQPSLGCER